MTATIASIDPKTRKALMEMLTDAVGPDVRLGAEPTPLRGGFWAELFAFELESPPDGWPREVVARVMPDPATAARETAIQAAVAERGYPTPKVRVHGGPGNPFGKAFSVMDRATGAPLLADLAGAGAIKRLPSIARRMPELLARAMADLHALDANIVASRDTDPLDHYIDHTPTLGREDLVRVTEWLAANRPADTQMVICHGDLHPFNVLADADRYTVLDWSAARIAPREYDVAFTRMMLSEPPLAVPGPVRPLISGIGRMLANRFLRTYERLSGATVDAGSLAWHEAVIALRVVVQVAEWAQNGEIDQHRGHPWSFTAPAFAERLRARTWVDVHPR